MKETADLFNKFFPFFLGMDSSIKRRDKETWIETSKDLSMEIILLHLTKSSDLEPSL